MSRWMVQTLSPYLVILWQTSRRSDCVHACIPTQEAQDWACALVHRSRLMFGKQYDTWCCRCQQCDDIRAASNAQTLKTGAPPSLTLRKQHPSFYC